MPRSGASTCYDASMRICYAYPMRKVPARVLKDPEVAKWYFVTSLNCVAAIAAGSVVFGVLTNRSPLDLPLIATLLTLVFIVTISWNRFGLTWNEREPKPSLAIGFHVLLLAIALHAAKDQTLLDRMHGFWAGAVGGLALSVLLLSRNRPLNAFAAIFTVSLLVFAGWGTVQIANCLFDSSPGIELQANIEAKQITVSHCTASRMYSSCSGVDQHLLVLSSRPTDVLAEDPLPYPWALGVDGGFYNSVQADTTLCFFQHSGGFGGRWYSFDRCRKNVS